MTHIDDIARFATSLTSLSRPIVKRWFRQKPLITQKDNKTPVTDADKEIETALSEAIAKTFPDHAIIGEELSSQATPAEYTWVIDPIDGTRSFACGNPLFGTLIAVLWQGKPVIGIIDLPASEQTWLGIKGKPCLLNGVEARTASTTNLQQARIVTTSTAALGADAPRFVRLAESALVTNYGGDCANYAHLASGWCDVVAESNLHIYDIMAVVPIIESAGGVISSWSGGSITLENYDGTALASATQELHKEALEALK